MSRPYWIGSPHQTSRCSRQSCLPPGGGAPMSEQARWCATARGLRAARLNVIKADVEARLGQRELTVTAVAVLQRVSPRYVQMLFQTEGTTFSKFVLGRRLVQAHRLLGDPRCAGWTITAIALEAGFGDLSTFNHAFRRAFGASPSSVRAAVRREYAGRQ